MREYKRKEETVAQHLGVFRKRISLFEGVALIISGTIGAGVLGIPYAVAQSGMLIGFAYIVGLGLLMMGLNLMLGEVMLRTNQSFQLAGLARKYLGRGGQWLMTAIVYASLFGVLVIYTIGEGETLAALFGGDPFWWSLGFFALGASLVAIGMRTVKVAEMFLTLGILFVVLIIAALTTPHIQVVHWQYSNLAHLLLPYGVVLFAFKGSTAIPEVHSVLKDKDMMFKHAIIIAGVITILIYMLFAFMVVGVTGEQTTEIATIGLGNSLGRNMLIFGNVFAALAMATSFLFVGLALRDSLRWDFKVPTFWSSAIVTIVPLTVFLLGIRQFIAMIDFVGGVFASLEMLLIILIYWRARHIGDVKKLSKYKLHHVWLLAALLVLVFTLGALYSVIKLF